MLILSFVLFSFKGWSQDSLYFRAKAYLTFNQYDSAYYFVNAALKKEPENIHYWLLKGDILFNQKHWDGAINSYLVVAKKKPQWVNYNLARCFALTGNYTKSINYLEHYLNQRGRIETYKIELDTCFREMSKTKQWEKFWSKDFDNAYQDFLEQVEYNIRYEHYTEALEQIDNYLVSHPKKYFLYYLKGNILLKLKDKDAALDAYGKAYSLKPRNKAIANAYGNILYDMKKYKKARQVFVQYNATAKYDIMPLRDIGKCDLALKKIKKAQQELEEFVRYYHKDAEGNFYLAQTYYRQKEYFNALRSINVAVLQDSTNFDYLFTRGKIYLDSQAYKLAKKDFLLALDISNAQSGELFFLIGVCYRHLGDPGMACRYWKKAYEHQYMEADDYRMKYCQ